MATAICSFRRPIRVIMGDRDPTVQQYSDCAIDDTVKTVLQMGKLPGYGLTTDETGITPDLVTWANGLPDPNRFALVVYWAAKYFIMSTPDSYSYRTRALSERFGHVRLFLMTLESEIHTLENGHMFAGMQSYYNWLAGFSGLPIWEIMTDMELSGPFMTALVSPGGLTFTPPHG